MTRLDRVPRMSYQYPPQYAPHPPRRQKRKPVALIVAVAVMSVLVLCIGVVTIYGVTQDKKPTTPNTPAAGSPAPSSGDARPGVDVGAGTPGAPCSTDRLGKTFVKDGVTYTCQGPAPYKWRQ